MSEWPLDRRSKRLNGVAEEDQRTAFERDRDRVLYSSAFHRLAGITQIAKSGEEDVFHTRQQHSYKVAQVGRRLAQKCLRDDPNLAERYGVHEEVVEAACLAHDLGHAPFGHIGEACLDELMLEERDADGFEGNAQSFRILTKLGVRFLQANGLDLTRATLVACLKYPWTRNRDDPVKGKKWSVYRSEEREFQWAREDHGHEYRSAEAHLMDWADDIAYSVHDLEDFHRCRAVPWREVLFDGERKRMIRDKAVESWRGAPDDAQARIEAAQDRLDEFFAVFQDTLQTPYDGLRDQRQGLRTLTSRLISRYVMACSLGESNTGVVVSQAEEDEVRVLKQITRDYIIANPSLAAQQHGYKNVIRSLFNAILDEIGTDKPRPPAFLPRRLEYLWELSDQNTLRFASDCICSLTEREALGLHARLTGASSGSVLDPIVR